MNPVMQPFKSSVIKSAGYLASESTLDIEFLSGKRYRYFGVGDTVWTEFTMADSVGRFYNREIKGVFDSESLTASAKPTGTCGAIHVVYGSCDKEVGHDAPSNCSADREHQAGPDRIKGWS